MQTSSKQICTHHSCQPTIIPTVIYPCLEVRNLTCPGFSYPAFKQWSQPCDHLGKSRVLLGPYGTVSLAEHTKKNLANGTISKSFTCHQNSVCVSDTSYLKIRGPSRLHGTPTRPSPMGEGDGSSQIEHCHRAYNLAYLSSNCPPPQGGHLLIRGEKGWTLAQDTYTHKLKLALHIHE